MNLPISHLAVTLVRYTGGMVGRQMKRIVTIAAVGILAAQPFSKAWASGAGTTGAEILKIGVGARAIAMGEAYAAQADDVSSLYWNPGGLALMQERQAS